MAQLLCSRFLSYYAFLAAILLYFVNAENKCIQENACLCRFNAYKEIDISPLMPSKESEPIAVRTITGNEIFYFHGCHDGLFKKVDNSSVPYSLLIEQQIKVGNNTYKSFTSEQMKIVPDGPTNYTIVYETKNKVMASVRLDCSHDELGFSILSIIDAKTNALVLISPHACIVTNHPGLSTGSVFLILFFTGSGIYLIGGMLYLYYMRGARGIEVIPNVDFWRSVPGLAKDGLIFLLSGCRPTFISTAETYDRI